MEVVSCSMVPPPPQPPPATTPLFMTIPSLAPLPPPPLPAPLLPPSAPPPLERDSGIESQEVQNFPQPRSRMRRLQWTKIPANRIAGRRTLWTGAENVLDQLDFERMEELFALPSQGQAVGSASGGKGGTKYEDTMNKSRTRIREEINILDSRRSLNVNVFLRQFRMSHSDLIQFLARAESRSLGCEKLRGLLRILPTDDEITRLRSYAGQRSRLGIAERFCLELMDLPGYAVKVEAMLAKEEFIQTVADRIRPALGAAILSVKDLNSNMALHEILHMVLMAGNFLNSGASSGNAAGFRLNSLLNLTEIRSNMPKMTLLHYVAWEAEKNKPQLLHFPEQLSHLKECSEYSLESLKLEVQSLADTITSISERLKQTELEFEQTMAPFIKYAKEQLVDLEKNMAELESLRLELAAYLCEDESAFKLDECIKVFQSFCEKFNRAVKENRERNIEEKSCEKRRKSVEASHIQRPLRLNSKAETEDVDVFVGTLLSDTVNRSHVGRRSRNRSQSVSDFGRICDSYMVGDDNNCANDEKSIQRQFKSKQMNKDTAEPMCESSEGVEEPLSSSPFDRIKQLNDGKQTFSIMEEGYSGPINASGPNRSDRILGPPIDFSVNKTAGKRNSKSRLRRFASSFEDGRERIYTSERDFGQPEILQENCLAAKGVTGRRILVKTKSVDGSNCDNTTRTDSFPEINGAEKGAKIGAHDERRNISIHDAAHSFHNGGQKVSLERFGVRIGLELSSPDGAKLPFEMTVSVSKSGDDKDDVGSDARQRRDSWELNSEKNICEKSGENIESHKRRGMEKELRLKRETVVQYSGQPVNKEQLSNEEALLNNDLAVANPKKKNVAVEGDQERHPMQNEIRIRDVDFKDQFIAEENAKPTYITPCSHSEDIECGLQSEIIDYIMSSDPNDNMKTITDDGCTEHPTEIRKTECENNDNYGARNLDSMPSHQSSNETSNRTRNREDVNHDQEKHRENYVDCSFSEESSESQRFMSFKPKLSSAMKNRLQKLSVMYSESDSEDWYSSPVMKAEPIDGIRKGTLKGTLICDMAKLSEFLCSSDDNGAQAIQKDGQVKKETKIPSQAASRKKQSLSSAGEVRSTLPRSSSCRNAGAASNTRLSAQVSSSSTLTKRVAKPVMPRTQPSKPTNLTAPKANAVQKKHPSQRRTNDSKDASSVRASQSVLSVASPSTERKEMRKPGQASVFTRLAAPKTSVNKGPSPAGSLLLYLRAPASSNSPKVEESKSLYSGRTNISRAGKTPVQSCSVENRHPTKIPSSNKDSKPIQRPLSPKALPKTMSSRVIALGSCNQLMLRRKSIDSNASSDQLLTLLSKNICHKTQFTKDTKDHKLARGKFDLQQSVTHSKLLEDHKITGRGDTQSNRARYEQQCLSNQSGIMDNLQQLKTSQEPLRTNQLSYSQGHKMDIYMDQNLTNSNCPSTSKPTAKVAPLKINNTSSASGLPRKFSAKSMSPRQATKQT